MTAIIQGSQYYLPVELSFGATKITDQNCDDVKIKLDETELQSSEGDIEYGSYTILGQTYSGWLFPLSQELTLKMSEGVVPIQAQVRIGTSIHPTDITLVSVNETIIT